MSLSGRVIPKFNLNEKCQTFQSAFLLFLQSQRNMAALNEVRFENLKEMINDEDVTLIDVREPEELKDTGKIPGAVNIPSGSIEEAFSLPPSIFESKYGVKMPDPETSTVILSCRSGRRAAAASEKVSRLGYKNAQVYAGSFQDWVEKGGPVEKV